MAGKMFQSRLGVLASNWLFQGMRYMNAYELGLKIFINAALIALLYKILKYSSLANPLIFSAIIAHTANWLLNGHFFALMRYIRPVTTPAQDFDDFLQKLISQIADSRHIIGVAVYGSYCRGELHQHSDLDVRIISDTGLKSGLVGALFCSQQRLRAFISAFPLDIFCCVHTRGLERLRSDEMPIILRDTSGMLQRYYHPHRPA